MNRPSSIRIHEDVTRALLEDLGDRGDITGAWFDRSMCARIVCRDSAILAGCPWVDAVFSELSTDSKLNWHVRDGAVLSPGQIICDWYSSASVLLAAERTSLNFLQLLSGTATITRQYASRIERYPTVLLDTRKTLPGLRHAQKYAVHVGGGQNHRMGLFDAVLIKENHIIAAGGLIQAIQLLQKACPGVPIETEVENREELEIAFQTRVQRVLLDNFTPDETVRAVAMRQNLAPACMLESSGGITLDNIESYAAAGVDFVSIGALTKDVHAVDYSMRLIVS